MIKNKRLEERRKKISKDIDLFVKHSFDIVDRIHYILKEKNMEQKDLAKLLGKSESEISKWMTGTHNFTINTISKIENVLGESILQFSKENKTEGLVLVYFKNPEYSVKSKKKSSQIPMDWNTIICSSFQKPSDYLN